MPTTPPRRLRSTPSKALGWVLFALGAAVALLNLGADLGLPDPLPGGHSPLWLGAGLIGGGWGLWLAGVMDAR